MAIAEVKVPQLSESVAEATLLQWKKKAGESVAADEILIEIETDKVVLEVPAPSAGVLAEIVVADGTSEATLERCKAVGERLGKDCIVVRDFPGFATSRLGVCLGLEAIRMLEQKLLPMDEIVKLRLPLREFQKGIDLVLSGETSVKVTLEP